MSIGIYIATGKKIGGLVDNNYLPINVGKDNIDGMLTDKTGESISSKNPYYCEMTALYWIWKNRNLEDFIGLCHYRRFFDLVSTDPKLIIEQASYISDITEKISTRMLTETLNQYDIILPTKQVLMPSVRKHYNLWHRKEDLDVTQNIIYKKYPDYKQAFIEVMNSNLLSPFNMFITNKDIFNDYMTWIFNILFEVENSIQIPYDDPVQRRVFGYLAERLLNVYVRKNNLKVLERPVVFLDYGNTGDNRVLKKDIKYDIKTRFRTTAIMLWKLKNLMK